MNETDNPEVHAWRIRALEDSLKGVHAKLDQLSGMVQTNACPQPGLCLSVNKTTDRLAVLMEKMESRVAQVETEIVVAKTSGRVLVGGATAIGTLVAGLVSLTISLWKK